MPQHTARYAAALCALCRSTLRAMPQHSSTGLITPLRATLLAAALRAASQLTLAAAAAAPKEMH